MKIKFLLGASLIFISGCRDAGCQLETDQRVRHIIYEKCVSSLKDFNAERSLTNKSKQTALAGVSKQCDEDAYYQSKYKLCIGEEARPDITSDWLLSIEKKHADD